MVIYEMRDSAYDQAFNLLEEAKHSAKKTKLTLCELEDAMYDCYEASKEDHEDYEEDDEKDIEFRNRRDYRHEEYRGVHEDDGDEYTRSGMRRLGRYRSMRMRRNRMG